MQVETQDLRIETRAWLRFWTLALLIVCFACKPSSDPSPSLDQPVDSASDTSSVKQNSEKVCLIDPPAGEGSMAPFLTRLADGDVVLSWLEPENPEVRKMFSLRMARWDGLAWAEPVTIHRGEGFFANWADLPMVAQRQDGSFVAHWLGKLGEGTYAYGIHLVSSGKGEVWTPAGLLHDDDSPTEHGFVSWLPSPNGLHAFWLDGREMKKDGPMTLRGTRLGAESPGTSELLDDRVCECCSTDAAWTSGGPVVVYRDRDEEEIRNISVVRFVDGTWSKPTTLHDDGWKIQGCPVNGPAIAATDETIAVAWFTVVENRSRVQVAFSDDAAKTFSEPLIVDADQPLGRVDLEFDHEGTANILWLARQGDAAEIRLRSIHPNGELGPSQVIKSTTQSRSAGVPRLLRNGDHFLVAWVEDTKPSQIQVARVL